MRVNRPNRPEINTAPADDAALLTTRQVADAVGVGVSTIKRWVDDGLLPAHRTAGGHRKLVLADVLRLTREGVLSAADPCGLVSAGSTPDAARFRQQLQDAVRRLDEGKITAVIRAARRARLPADVLADQVVAPAMAFVGNQWEHGRIDILGEHRVTQAVVAALYETPPVTTGTGRPVAIGGAPERDHYILPSLLAKLTLAEAGWDAVNVGPNTPAGAFVAAMDQLRPQLLWVSVSRIVSEAAFESDYRMLYAAAVERGVAVVLGGRALTPALRARLPYTTFGDGMGHLAAFARSLRPLPRRPRRGRPPAKA